MKKNIVEENRENDEKHNDENYNYITDRSFEASRLQGFCNRNRNFNIQLRKFNSEYRKVMFLILFDLNEFIWYGIL